MILVPTIPHTGTHFVRDHLLVGRECYVEHIWPHKIDEWMERIAAAPRDPVIVPLRHPLEVAKSWKRRHKAVSELPLWWFLLVSKIDPVRPWYLPLDSENRDTCLGVLNNGTGLNLATDWPVLRERAPPGGRSAYRGDVKLTNQELESVAHTMDNLKAFFERWYSPPQFHLPGQDNV